MQETKQLQNEFWSRAAQTKEFKDPFYLTNLQPYLKPDSLIVDYGCGYGRLLNILYENNYRNCLGFDFSNGMIERGTKQFPHLTMQLINHAVLPLQNDCADAAILSTVLCCVPDKELQTEIIREITRILKPDGVLYLTDFLVTDINEMKNKYDKDFPMFQDWGVYRTAEGAIVKHHSQEYISDLLSKFKVVWYQEETFVTMNNHPVRSFHGIYQISQ